MCEALLVPTPVAPPPCCTFRVLNGCIKERKGLFLNGKGPKTPSKQLASVLCCFQYNLNPKCTSRQKCTFPGPITIKFAPGKVHLGTQKGPKTQNKIGERPVLFLRFENRVGGSVCEALLEPTSPFLSFGGILWSLRAPTVCYSLTQGGST